MATRFLDKASSMCVPTAVFSALQPVECLAKSGDVFEAFVLVKRVECDFKRSTYPWRINSSAGPSLDALSHVFQMGVLKGAPCTLSSALPMFPLVYIGPNVMTDLLRNSESIVAAHDRCHCR